MHVLVTGGTGVVGKAAVDRLLGRGHTVRLFSRNAEEDHLEWPSGVEPYAGSVGNDADVKDAAMGCDAILHIAGIVDESPPEATFENINVEGTLRMIEEAKRSGVDRFVYVSSLGADRGTSEYHQSKLAGEEIVKTFPGNWLICRPGNVYGPGDEVISLLLKMVRTLPAIPVIGGGDHVFQPIAADDLGSALALAMEWKEPTKQVLELAGEEQITVSELLDLLEDITDRRPPRVPIPEVIALAGAQIADLVGVDVPVKSEQIIMLLEENVIPPERENALITVFGVTPQPLIAGLNELADSQPVKPLSEGVGRLHRQRYWADIASSRCTADELFRMVREDFYSLLPESLLDVGTEPGTPQSLEEGATLTMAVPLRGNIQVRVEEIADRTATMATVEGHHLAGVIRFFVDDLADLLRFEIRSYSRASGLLDNLGMKTIGRQLQKVTWVSVVEEVVRRSGGVVVDEVQREESALTDEEATSVEEWAQRLVNKQQREEKTDRIEAERHGQRSD
ncbi:hypothetical protein BH23GEM6_BH23GEM6_09840 [soil metagenome]